MINIVANEKVNSSEGIWYCNNIEIKNILDEVNKTSKARLICRLSSNSKSHRIQSKNISAYKNIFSYLFSIFDNSKIENSIFLIISITPYTFFSILLLKLLKKKYLIYLRSDGFIEYKKILGYVGLIIYKLIFTISTSNSKIISSGKSILKNLEGEMITPSSLSSLWSLNTKPVKFDKIKLLYVGRLRVEKGIFSLISIFEKIKSKMKLTIIGNDDRQYKKSSDSRIEYKGIMNDEKELIKNYDDHSILILPSYTEAYSMVIDEALIRLRPVIIFEDIKEIIGDRKGIFVTKRNEKDLIEKINYISNNYENILREIKKNKFVTKQDFAKQIFEKLKNIT